MKRVVKILVMDVIIISEPIINQIFCLRDRGVRRLRSPIKRRMRMLGKIKNWFNKKVDNMKKWTGKSCGQMLSNNYGKDKKGKLTKTCDDIIDDIYRPFATCDLKYYPHHGLYQYRRWDGAVSSRKGGRPVVPCGMGNSNKPKGLHVVECWYEINLNRMDHYVMLSNGKKIHSFAIFPKVTDSYLFGGIIPTSNKCIQHALEQQKGLEITFN